MIDTRIMRGKEAPLKEYCDEVSLKNLELVQSCLLLNERVYFESLMTKGVEKVNVTVVMSITGLCRATVKKYLGILGKMY